jgi:hypothetical protein
MTELREAGVGEEAETLLTNPVAEREARFVIERLALALAAATLTKQAPSAVSDGFIARRLRQSSVTFGASAAAIDEDAIISRLSLLA